MKRYIISVLIGLIAALLFISCNEDNKQSENLQKRNIIEAQTTTEKAEKNNSIYQFDSKWTNQDNEEIELSDLKGKIQITAMIFTSCGYACPKMVDNIKTVESELPDDLKDKVEFTLFTFDTKVDTPEKLKKYAQQKELGKNWTLLHGKDRDVRTISMLLNTQYKSMTNGMFSHSNMLTIIDTNGNIIKQFEGLELSTRAIIEAIEQADS